MRAVQAYLLINDRPLGALFNDVDLLVWKLSVIRNKKLGFTTVLYTDDKTLEALNEKDIAHLYDEIHVPSIKKLDHINMKYFWAAFKFIAIEEEMKLGTDFFVVDTDLVFMDEHIIEELKKPILVWSNEEPFKNYPDPRTLVYPDNFKYPRYFDAFVRPVTTAIIRVENPDILRDWLDLCWKFMINNSVDGDNVVGHMITCEQRFLPNVILGKYHATINAFITEDVLNFGKEHFHIWGTKTAFRSSKRIYEEWLKTMLLLIKQEDPDEYERILDRNTVNIDFMKDIWDQVRICPLLGHYLKPKEDELGDELD